MIWSAFRPSDDAVRYAFNVPANALAVVALRDIVQLAQDGYGDAHLAEVAQSVGARAQVGIERYGRFYNADRHAWMYAYETDGYGHYNLMDDANIPNLTTLPYIDWCSAFDATYLATRKFALSMDNPYYFSGRYAQGLGSPAHAVRFRLAARHHRTRAYRDVLGGSCDGDHDAGRNGRRERVDPRKLLSRRVLAIHARRVRLGQRIGCRAILSQPHSRRFGDPNSPGADRFCPSKCARRPRRWCPTLPRFKMQPSSTRRSGGSCIRRAA